MAIYIIACIAVISYANFRENQRMFLLCLFTYATAFFEVFRILTSVALLVLMTFVFLEYLTEDSKKLSLITKLRYKIYDYAYMMFFQYHFLWVIAAFALLRISRSLSDAAAFETAVKCLSAAVLFVGSHLMISQPFKIKSITEICRVFEIYPPYQFNYREEMREKFELLCAFEDKTYFRRKNSYSCISFEYLRCFMDDHGLYERDSFKKVLSSMASAAKNPCRKVSKLLGRGYSTPEMQLLRTVGIARGYDKYKIQRKIFEVVYSKIFFSSLKDYHKANTYLELENYRQYILYVYFQTVMTKINGHRCMPLSSAFKNPEDISNWSMDGLFIACLGLSFRKVSDYNLALFGDVVNTFGLNAEHIKELNAKYPSEPFPSEDIHTAAESLP